VVYLRGAITFVGKTVTAQFATLPTAIRPDHNQYLQIFTYGAVASSVYIGTKGVATVFDGNAASFASLGGLSYRVSTAKAIKAKLINGWNSDQSIYRTGDPAYQVSGGVVYQSGSMHGGRPLSPCTTPARPLTPSSTASST
jgi:hypothetical protein